MLSQRTLGKDLRKRRSKHELLLSTLRREEEELARDERDAQVLPTTASAAPATASSLTAASSPPRTPGGRPSSVLSATRKAAAAAASGAPTTSRLGFTRLAEAADARLLRVQQRRERIAHMRGLVAAFERAAVDPTTKVEATMAHSQHELSYTEYLEVLVRVALFAFSKPGLAESDVGTAAWAAAMRAGGAAFGGAHVPASADGPTPALMSTLAGGVHSEGDGEGSTAVASAEEVGATATPEGKVLRLLRYMGLDKPRATQRHIHTVGAATQQYLNARPPSPARKGRAAASGADSGTAERSGAPAAALAEAPSHATVSWEKGEQHVIDSRGRVIDTVYTMAARSPARRGQAASLLATSTTAATTASTSVPGTPAPGATASDASAQFAGVLVPERALALQYQHALCDVVRRFDVDLASPIFRPFFEHYIDCGTLPVSPSASLSSTRGGGASLDATRSPGEGAARGERGGKAFLYRLTITNETTDVLSVGITPEALPASVFSLHVLTGGRNDVSLGHSSVFGAVAALGGGAGVGGLTMEDEAWGAFEPPSPVGISGGRLTDGDGVPVPALQHTGPRPSTTASIAALAASLKPTSPSRWHKCGVTTHVDAVSRSITALDLASGLSLLVELRVHAPAAPAEISGVLRIAAVSVSGRTEETAVPVYARFAAGIGRPAAPVITQRDLASELEQARRRTAASATSAAAAGAGESSGPGSARDVALAAAARAAAAKPAHLRTARDARAMWETTHGGETGAASLAAASARTAARPQSVTASDSAVAGATGDWSATAALDRDLRAVSMAVTGAGASSAARDRPSLSGTLAPDAVALLRRGAAGDAASPLRIGGADVLASSLYSPVLAVAQAYTPEQLSPSVSVRARVPTAATHPASPFGGGTLASGSFFGSGADDVDGDYGGHGEPAPSPVGFGQGRGGRGSGLGHSVSFAVNAIADTLPSGRGVDLAHLQGQGIVTSAHHGHPAALFETSEVDQAGATHLAAEAGAAARLARTQQARQRGYASWTSVPKSTMQRLAQHAAALAAGHKWLDKAPASTPDAASKGPGPSSADAAAKPQRKRPVMVAPGASAAHAAAYHSPADLLQTAKGEPLRSPIRLPGRGPPVEQPPVPHNTLRGYSGGTTLRAPAASPIKHAHSLAATSAAGATEALGHYLQRALGSVHSQQYPGPTVSPPQTAGPLAQHRDELGSSLLPGMPARAAAALTGLPAVAPEFAEAVGMADVANLRLPVTTGISRSLTLGY